MSNCQSGVLTNDLAIFIDISNPLSWDLDNSLILNSLVSHPDSLTDDLNIPEFGTTAIDNGSADNISTPFYSSIFDNKFSLSRVGYNDLSGNTLTTNYEITPILNEPLTGNYFNLNGGYSQGFFKLNEYNYQLFPYRYNDGFCVETWLKPVNFDLKDKNIDGIFFYMGARAENKFYVDEFTESGEPVEGSILEYENSFALRITQEGYIGYRYLDKLGFLEEEYTEKKISFNEWQNINVNFIPYKKIPDFEILIDCYPARLGDLQVSVNGRLFHTFKNVKEFWSKPLETEKEKQVGASYNISWGGGSFGLRHSVVQDGNLDLNYDLTKENLPIEKFFGGSFYGSVQKLRFYTRRINLMEVWGNFEAEKAQFQLKNNMGGRLIYT